MSLINQELTDLNQLVSLCKRRGIIFPSSEIYGGINACWDYGPLGVEMKRNIKDFWWNAMTRRRDIEGIDAAILMHPQVWVASGHVGGFVDPLVDCKNCKNRFRADKIENPKICPNCKGELTEPRNFNLMFKTFMGALEDTSATIYLRPETAQGIYVNFLNVQQSSRQKVPFGIAQIGKAFRNEITPGNFIFRTREFEQMEMQFFIHPSEDTQWFDYWKQLRMDWHQTLGLRPQKLRFHPHGPQELAHYAKAAFDIEYEFPFGWQELEGIHNRSDFDLKNHQQMSGKRLEYFDESNQSHFLPFIIETSAGCDRTLLAVLCDSYTIDGERTYLKLHPQIAPTKAAILPLMKKSELLELSNKILNDLQASLHVSFDEAGSIGKRYRRQDEVGTPYCVTIDYDSLSQHSVTIRHRDTMKQERIAIDQLKLYLLTHLNQATFGS